MKNFHTLSFGLGLASGVLILLIFVGGMHVMAGSGRGKFQGQSGGNWQQRQGGMGGPGMSARMAERLGISQEELQKELDSGKTMQDIAKEHGIELPAGRGMMQGGRNTASSSSGASSLSSAPSSSAQQ